MNFYMCCRVERQRGRQRNAENEANNTALAKHIICNGLHCPPREGVTHAGAKQNGGQPATG